MLPERLHARIRHQLALPSPDLEARALAAELAEMGGRARERLEQCATLLRVGNEQAALQAAETEPSLPELCAWLGFAGSEEWARLCEKHGLPVAPQPDDAQVLAVELLYGKPIDENHPLYRDYRQAIRERDDARALTVLRSIGAVNPGDANAQAELNRLRSKYMRASLEKVSGHFARGEHEAAIRLMERMEQLGTAGILDDPGWVDAMGRRAAQTAAQGRARLAELARRADAARTGGDWRACADEIGAARTLERNAGVTPAEADAARLAACEAWAGEHVAAEAAEHRARVEAEWLRDAWRQLSAESERRESADLLRRVRRWLERAQAGAGRAEPEHVEAAERMARALHQRLVRRHTLRIAGGVALLLTVVFSGHLAYQSLRADSAFASALEAAGAPLEAWDYEGVERALAGAETLARTSEMRARLTERAATVRGEIQALRLREQALANEAAALSEARSVGVSAANFAETRRRARELGQALSAVGPAAATRLKAKAGDIPALIARCESVAAGLRAQVEGLSAELERAVGPGERLADPAKAEATAARIRSLLGAPGAAEAAGSEASDHALALAERVGERLGLDRAREISLRELSGASDLRAYLAVLGKLAEDATDSPERRSARLVVAGATELAALPRCLLGPRLGAMWDAAETPDTGVFTMNAEEARAAARILDDGLVRGLRKFIIREHRSPEPGVSEATPIGFEFISGPLSSDTRRIASGTETVYTAKVLRSSGDLVERTWKLRTFTNGVVSGEEPAEGVPLPEVDYLRRFSRNFAVNGDRLAEPPLRTLERVRRETGTVVLRAYHLQELFRLAELRPAASGLAFSPSAQRDAAELRGITQNGLTLTEFVFGGDAALRAELAKFHARSAAAYVEEARYLRALVEAMRRGDSVLVGKVGTDGRPQLGNPAKPGTLLLGLDIEGKASVLFDCGPDGTPRIVRQPAPLTPLLMLSAGPAEAAEAAGRRPAEVPAPAGGWNSLLQGKDI